MCKEIIKKARLKQTFKLKDTMKSFLHPVLDRNRMTWSRSFEWGELFYIKKKVAGYYSAKAVCFRQPTTGKRASMVRRLGELRLPMKPSRIRPALMHLGIREGVKVRVLHRTSGVHHTFHRDIFPSNPPGVSFENIKAFQLIIFETHLNLVSLSGYFSVRLRKLISANIS